MARNNNHLARKPNNSSYIKASYSGPIPPASELEKYERICPGAADRMIAMAEKQSEHRQELEKKVIEGRIKDSRMGVIFAFVIGMTALVCGAAVVVKGYSAEGLTIGGAGIIGLVSVFIYGTRANRKERQEKDMRL